MNLWAFLNAAPLQYDAATAGAPRRKPTIAREPLGAGDAGKGERYDAPGEIGRLRKVRVYIQGGRVMKKMAAVYRNQDGFYLHSKGPDQRRPERTDLRGRRDHAGLRRQRQPDHRRNRPDLHLRRLEPPGAGRQRQEYRQLLLRRPGPAQSPKPRTAPPPTFTSTARTSSRRIRPRREMPRRRRSGARWGPTNWSSATATPTVTAPSTSGSTCNRMPTAMSPRW